MNKEMPGFERLFLNVEQTIMVLLFFCRKKGKNGIEITLNPRLIITNDNLLLVILGNTADQNKIPATNKIKIPKYPKYPNQSNTPKSLPPN
ncbi:hypothetical protein [Lysinibacillus fusiformis]|uniref:hypothetical protein n=1 Tax=Lysinibacillus fusiformis TaxID=28031 RepID=UPI0023A9EB67|nr:hypothetical protein [Lysinibacillus fusiformis]